VNHKLKITVTLVLLLLATVLNTSCLTSSSGSSSSQTQTVNREAELERAATNNPSDGIAQVPTWMKDGMSLEEIRRALPGVNLRRSNTDNNLYYHDRDDITYQYAIDARYGLYNYMIMVSRSSINFYSLINDFVIKYGDQYEIIDNYFTWDFRFSLNTNREFIELTEKGIDFIGIGVIENIILISYMFYSTDKVEGR